MERQKRSKGSVWEFWYANKIFGTFGFEMTACGQKLVKFCTLTHIHTTAAKLVVRISQSRNQFSCSPLYVVKRSYVCPFCRVVVKLALNILNEVYVYCFTKRYNQPITFIWFTFILIIIINNLVPSV